MVPLVTAPKLPLLDPKTIKSYVPAAKPANHVKVKSENC